MIGPRQDIPRLQSDFYRDQLRKTIRWLIGAMVIIYLLLAGIFYWILFQPQPTYFANTTEGKLLSMPRMKVG